jgi:hypothetical protein
VARSTWSAKWAKSAERIEGASSIKTGNLGLPKGDCYPEISARGALRRVETKALTAAEAA